MTMKNELLGPHPSVPRETIVSLRERLNRPQEGDTTRSLAEEFNVSRTYVSNVRLKKTWLDKLENQHAIK